VVNSDKTPQQLETLLEKILKKFLIKVSKKIVKKKMKEYGSASVNSKRQSQQSPSYQKMSILILSQLKILFLKPKIILCFNTKNL
jgi:hypothetical protein